MAGAFWLTDTIDPAQIRGGADSFLVLREMAAQGDGIGIMPCCLGDHDPRLARLADAMPRLSVPIWVASHAEVAAVPRLRKFRAGLCSAMAEIKDWLAGTDQ